MVCDMIMTEILVHLPPESIFMYRSVSKHWNRLLTSPEFQSHYAACFHRKQRSGSPRRLFGLIEYKWRMQPPTSLTLLDKWCWLLPAPTDKISALNLLTSSNGLVLLRCCWKPSYTESYLILNPVTRKHVLLPPLNRRLWRQLGLSCDEDGDDLTPRYEVVAVVGEELPHQFYDWSSKKLRIRTYSSDTKEWRESVLVGTSSFRLQSPAPPTAVNGVFYWVDDGEGYCFAYDPHNKQGGNKDRNHLQLIGLPYDPTDDDDRHYSSVVYKHEKRLVYGRSYDESVQIWELPETELGFWRTTTIGGEEWRSIHEVSLGTLCLRNPFMRIEQREEEESVAVEYDEELRLNRVRMELHWPKVVLKGFIPWNSSLLRVRLGSHKFLYNMETQVLEHITCFPKHLTNWGVHIFFEPTSFSSYLF